MFAQLLITLTLTGLVAEVLCRILLGGSVVTVAGEILGPSLEDAPAAGPAETATPSRREELRKHLGERRRDLKDLQSRLADRRRTAEVRADLASTEAEIARLTEELAEMDGRQDVGTSS